jgi:hypothetical protein
MPDITVTLDHIEPDAQRRTYFMREHRPDDPPNHPGEQVAVETVVHDGRGRADLTMDQASFERVSFPTKLTTSDFYDVPEKVRGAYYAEVEELFKQVTGAPFAIAFDHVVRNADWTTTTRGETLDKAGTNSSKPLHRIHSDSSCYHAEQAFQQLVLQVPECCRRGRFMYVNAWRSIADEPVEKDHMAVLDERSLVKPDDYILTDVYGDGWELVQYGLSARHADQHNWFYFPKMRRDEVLVWKNWDSDSTKTGRLCFHTAIEDPSPLPNAPPRQSIETRGFVFFPDHTPNTCPPFKPEGRAEPDEIEQNAGEKRRRR